jgi:phospholipid/cholesterol/gamma-HCH transport system ATP-binding protein
MIEIVNLRKSFDDHLVLDGLNLKIETGQTTVIIGRSGCGKSVLLKHIIGILRPDSGKVYIDGQDITKMRQRQLNKLRMKIGMLFQSSALFDSLTVEENVGFALREHTDLSEVSISKRVRDSLSLVGLEGIEKLKPAQLSGGMKKRVGLARAICMRPQILLYDEPTTGVDPIMGDAINDLIKELHDKLKITSIVVTHDIVSAYKVADKIAMLYKGKIIFEGTPGEIRGTPNPIVQQFIKGQARGPITESQPHHMITEI